MNYPRQIARAFRQGISSPAGWAAATHNEQERRAACFPELLEALEAMHTHVFELCFNYGVPLPDASISKSSAIIAKAKGESP